MRVFMFLDLILACSGDIRMLDTRDELFELFVDCVNVCEPPHPYQSNIYPITRSDVYEGWCREDGPYWAKCGPRRGPKPVLFKPSVEKLLWKDGPKLLAILTHELTHITEGGHTEGPVHNKPFWREMAFNAWQVRENLDAVKASINGENISEAEYITEVITEPNDFTVDGRIETVSERRSEMARLLGRDDSPY